MFSRALLAAALAGVVWPPSSALADEVDPAQALFDRGLADFQAGRFDTACPVIAESYRRDPRPGTLFTLAECEKKRGRAAAALDHYDEYLALYATLSADKKQRQGTRERLSREARAALAALVAEVTVRLPASAPPGTVVTRDAAPLADALLGVALRVDPGEHVFTTQVPGGPVAETRLTLGKGEKLTAVLEVRTGLAIAPPAGPASPDSPQGAAPAPQRPGLSGPRIVALATGAAGIAGLVVGGALGGLAQSAWNQATTACPKLLACSADAHDASVRSLSLATGSTVAFVAGGAAVAGGVVLWLAAPRSAPQTSLRVIPVARAGAAGVEVAGVF